MKLGQHYKSNSKKLKSVTIEQWAVVLKKCQEHVKLRTKQRTLFGAHSEKNLGEAPIHYYTSYAYEAIISGHWKWQDRFDLAIQMIRIINSRMSAEVEKVRTAKTEELKITYMDIESDLYMIGVNNHNFSDEESQKFIYQVEQVENAINGTPDLEFFWEGIKEGKKRAEIAELMDIKPKQLDKVKERFIRTVRNYNGFKNQNNEG